MWEERVRIYGTPGVHNNFPWNIHDWHSLFSLIYNLKKKKKNKNKNGDKIVVVTLYFYIKS